MLGGALRTDPSQQSKQHNRPRRPRLCSTYMHSEIPTVHCFSADYSHNFSQLTLVIFPPKNCFFFFTFTENVNSNSTNLANLQNFWQLLLDFNFKRPRKSAFVLESPMPKVFVLSDSYIPRFGRLHPAWWCLCLFVYLCRAVFSPGSWSEVASFHFYFCFGAQAAQCILLASTCQRSLNFTHRLYRTTVVFGKLASPPVTLTTIPFGSASRVYGPSIYDSTLTGIANSKQNNPEIFQEYTYDCTSIDTIDTYYKWNKFA